MSQILRLSTRVAAFGAACLMALAVNGAVLLGADQLATDGAQRHASTCATRDLVADGLTAPVADHAAV